jgi:NAD-dependent SIR2 family protein deacetylase
MQSRNVIDLHGHLDEVICMSCLGVTPRHALQSRLKLLNPSFPHKVRSHPMTMLTLQKTQFLVLLIRPKKLQQLLKPNVVFFRDNVNKSIVQRVYDGIDNSDGMLIIGTSFKVFSGYLFYRYTA